MMAGRSGASTHLRGGKGSRPLPRLASWLAVLAIVGLTPTPTHAHFKLNSPASWMSQDSVGGPQKNGPCAATPNTSLGDTAGTPTNTVTAFQSGQTIPVSVTATVGHPGWYRIALVEGASSTQTLSTLADPQAQTGTNCTPAIMSNPVWSTTQPILGDGLPAGSTASTQQTGTQTFQVTIPKSASCTSTKPCALQVIMVMTDHPANDCYYHHCADISLAAAADAGSDAAGTDAGRDASATGGSGASAGAGGAGGNGAGGVTGLGGTANAGGSTGSGGVTGRGGSTGTGGLAGAGGSANSGGATGTGGSTGSGGLTGSGGSVGPAGSTGTGGLTGSAGSGGSAGSSASSGGANGSGGSGGAIGSTGIASGAGGRTGSTVKSGSSSGCNLASHDGSSWFMIAAMLGALVALRARRRRR